MVDFISTPLLKMEHSYQLKKGQNERFQNQKEVPYSLESDSQQQDNRLIPDSQQTQKQDSLKNDKKDKKDCQTCKDRKYQDGSNDPGVSFKTPTKIAPNQAAAAVAGHEREHVVRERYQAQQNGRKIISQTVSIHSAICPECGRAYISGGTTRTVTKGTNEQDSMANTQDPDSTLGNYIDTVA